jgi:hypothetical protein
MPDAEALCCSFQGVLVPDRFAHDAANPRRGILVTLAVAVSLVLIGTHLAKSDQAEAHGGPESALRPFWKTMTQAELDQAARAQAAAMQLPDDDTLGSFEARNYLVGSLVERGVPLVIDNAVEDSLALLGRGYLPSHGWVTFKGEGLAFGRPPDGKPFTLDDPYVLLYAPKNKNLSDAELSDNKPDLPYEFIGAAWFSNYLGTARMDQTPPEAPPVLEPIPNGLLEGGGWFRHSGGCHMSNGEFVAFNENLPDPTASDAARLVTGVAWCAGIGIGSDFVRDSTTPRPLGGDPGRCVLDRNVNPRVGTPRPIMEGSYVTTRAPYLVRPLHPGPEPYVRDKPTFQAGDDLGAYLVQLGLWVAESAIHLAWQALAGTYNALNSSIELAADAKCQAIGAELTLGHGPTFWHGAAWDAHLFFRPDGTATAGIVDFTLVPNGYNGPSLAFTPITNFAHVVNQLKAPQSAPTSVSAIGGDGQLIVNWVAPIATSRPGEVPLPIAEYEVTARRTGIAPITVTVSGDQTQAILNGLSAQAHTVSVRAKNRVGLGPASAEATATVGGSAPAITFELVTTPNSDGYVRDALTLRVTATDPQNVTSFRTWEDDESLASVSTVRTPAASITRTYSVSDPGPAVFNITATDANGNESAAITVRAIVDKQPPYATFDSVGGQNVRSAPANYFSTTWYRGDVSAVWRGYDRETPFLLNKKLSPPNPMFIVGEGRGLTANATVTDNAGRTFTTTTPAINIDRTSPTTSVTGVQAGWTKSDVTATFTASDALSGVAATNYRIEGSSLSAPITGTGSTVTLSDEGMFTLNFWSTDVAGNVEAEQSVPVRIDKSAPSLTGAASSETPANAAGWHRGPVIVEWTTSDSLSGIERSTLPQPVTLSADGSGLRAQATVNDIAGNQRSAQSAPINIDSVAPVSSASGIPSAGATTATIRVTASDTASGVDAIMMRVDGAAAVQASSQTVTGGGSHSVEYWSVDVAGNEEAHRTVSFTLGTGTGSTTTSTTSTTVASTTHVTSTTRPAVSTTSTTTSTSPPTTQPSAPTTQLRETPPSPQPPTTQAPTSQAPTRQAPSTGDREPTTTPTTRDTTLRPGQTAVTTPTPIKTTPRLSSPTTSTTVPKPTATKPKPTTTKALAQRATVKRPTTTAPKRLALKKKPKAPRTTKRTAKQR